MTRRGIYPAEVRERAVRLVLEPQGEDPSPWAAITSIAAKGGMTAETLRTWGRGAEVDAGARAGLTSDERERLKLLERENRELRRANEILKAASAFFARELDPRRPKCPAAARRTGTASGSSRSAGCGRSPRPPTTPRARAGPRGGRCATRR